MTKMNAATEIDIGPLTWVKGEIDLALGRAEDALKEFEANRNDTAQLKFAQTHLHQAHGALAIVGLDGITQVSDALEQLIGDMEKRAVSPTLPHVQLTQQAIGALRHYLDDLVNGARNQPLRLLPVYERIQKARSQAQASPTDLFFPNLGLRPAKRAAEAPAVAAQEAQQRMKSARARFERGFLQWLRAADGTAGLADMRTAVAAIEELQTLPTARAFWWVTLGFLDALAQRLVPVDLTAKRLCARIDTQMRRTLEGARTVAERLMRDVLYQVAIAPGGEGHVRRVKETYELDALIPQARLPGVDIEPLRPALRALRECLQEAKEAWNRYSAGNAAGLPQFEHHTNVLVSLVAQLPNAPLQRLAQGIENVLQRLRSERTNGDDGTALEVATALLLVEGAAESFEHLDSDFARRAELMGERLALLAKGEKAPLTADAPLLGEMSRRAQERLFMSQVAHEIQTSLGQIEQGLDAFFRDSSIRLDIDNLTNAAKQVEGALSILGQDEAVALLRDCAGQIARFAAPGYEPKQQEFEAVAHRLSALGFFVQALQHGPADLQAILDPKREAAVAPEVATVEQDLERQKRAAAQLAEQLRERPEDKALRQDLKQNLENIRQEAALVADTKLEQHAKEALAALAAAAETAAAEMQAKVADIAPASPAAGVVPSPEVARMAEAPSEELDSELLSIFIEEAHEVLATVSTQLGYSRNEPHNSAHLTTIRRGFHTLKGSGRMVGLKDFGEAAWGVEQVMNRWLQLELNATSELHGMIADAHSLFSSWIEQLEAGGSPYKEASTLLAITEKLKAQGAPAPAEAATAPPHPTPAAPVVEAAAPPASLPVAEEELIELEEEAAPETQAIEAEGLGAVTAEESFAALAQASEEDVRVGEQVLSRSLYDMFLSEARTHVATLRHELGGADAAPLLHAREPTIRAAHTLAGISATVGFAPIHDLARALEQALARLVGEGSTPDREQSTLLRDSAAALEEAVEGVAVMSPPQPSQQLIARLAAVAPSTTASLEVLLEREEQELAPELLETLVVPITELGLEPVPAPTPEFAAVAPTDLVAAGTAYAPAANLVEAPERRKLRLQDDVDEQLLPIFLEESEDLAREIAAESRNWHKAPNDTEPAHALKRLLHTLKGSARMAGAMGLGELVHSIETKVEQAISNRAVTPAFFEEFDSSFDRAAVMIDQLRGVPRLSVEAASAQTPARAPIAEEAETGGQAVLRVRSDLVDRFVNEAGEMSIARSRIEGEMRVLRSSLLDLTENVIRLRSQLRELEIQAESQMQSRMAQAEAKHSEFDPLEFDRFTRLQELTRMIAEGVNDVGTVQHNVLKNLDAADAALVSQARLNRDLQQALMSVRMVPFNSLTERLYRIVRQTAKELGNKVNLDIRGGQVELDRGVLDKITGSLEHLLRNAVSHGLERPDERIRRGKGEIGQITLSVSQEGNEVAVELADDGAGLNFPRIRARAIEAGLLAADAQPSEAELSELIFRPGFSTAQEVSHVSGRGVGMDVVKNAATALGGRIEASSVHGQGARFRISLPQSLAVTQALLVRAAGKTYAIPSVMVDQVLELRPEALEKLKQEGAADWLGNRYPLHYMPRLLGDFETQPQTSRYTWVLLTRSAMQRVALHIDELRGNQEIVVKGIGPQLSRVVGIAGASVLGDGEVVLIINPVALASREVKPALSYTPTTDTAAPAPEKRVPTVMVVDDSLTVRKITGRLLERSGYRVLTAKDGVDALEQLLDEVPDVMLVDIEMPRMDGFDLTRNVRADARLKGVPIIVITSRIAEKHRKYAKEIGVNHYLGKPYQEEELIGLIKSYTMTAAEA